MSIESVIQAQIEANDVVLYMKGTKDFPMCGFSGQVVSVLKQYKVEFTCYNILEDAALRQGIKEFSDWPTIPQLYVNGEFVGGCDIITEMHQAKQLSELFDSVI